MSQLVATQPSSFFDQNGSFGYQGQFTREKDTFAYAQNGYEKGFDGLDQGKDSDYYSYYQYTMPMYNMYSNVNTPFYTTFPRAKDYYTQETVLEAFPHLEGLNDYAFDVNAVPEHAQFFILRSSNDDNIHKAIKYHMWSTTTSGKAALSNAWKEAEKKGLTPEIYLIFSVVNSNHILGIAKMTSDMNDDDSFKFWWEPMKWFGSFQIKWVFIKDIHYSKFEHIQEESFGSNTFGNLKDSSKLSLENGKEVLTIFRDFAAKSSIFGSFAYMDRREDYIRLQRENSYFNKSFEECCAAYKSNPETFSPIKKASQNRRGKYHGNNYNSYGNRRQGNGYYKKTFYTTKQSSNSYNNQNSGSHMTAASQEFLSISEYPPLSLAEQYGIKSQTKKKQLKSGKKNLSDSDEKGEKKEDDEQLSN